MQTKTLIPSTSLTNFRITRAFEADYAQYAHQQTAAGDLILKQYDVVAATVAAGCIDEAWILAGLLEQP